MSTLSSSSKHFKFLSQIRLREYVEPAKKEDVDPLELKQGISVEMEHTTDAAVAERIALQHLAEDPKYYTKLKKVEGK